MLLKATLKAPLAPALEYGWETQTESAVVLLDQRHWELLLTVLLFKGLGCVRTRFSSAQQKLRPALAHCPRAPGQPSLTCCSVSFRVCSGGGAAVGALI